MRGCVCVWGDDDEHFAIIIIYAKLNLINVFEQIFSAIIKVSPFLEVSLCLCLCECGNYFIKYFGIGMQSKYKFLIEFCFKQTFCLLDGTKLVSVFVEFIIIYWQSL